jgi:hypothetical protein
MKTIVCAKCGKTLSPRDARHRIVDRDEANPTYFHSAYIDCTNAAMRMWRSDRGNTITYIRERKG